MYDADDAAALLREHPQFHRPSSVTGPRLTFRLATPDDAEFILSLRLDPTKNAYLSPVGPEVAEQRRYLEASETDTSQLYFVIEHEGRPVGTVRLYDQQGTSFCWGSWILSADAPKSAAVESTLMVYQVGMDLGFSASHFSVRKENEKVWQYHERMGAERISETDADFHYSITKSAILAAFTHYKERGRVEVIW